MKKKVERRSRTKAIVLIVLGIFFFMFIFIPFVVSAFDGAKFGNVAIIPIEGVITGSGGGSFGSQTLASRDIVDFIKAADESKQVQVIVLEINSPGGGAVASDEIATAVKKTKKPVVALIREVGASGGYWIASATEHIIANRMSITGSIGVISSYLEFSGMMEEYGVGYERLVAGSKKDVGTPFRKLKTDEKDLLEQKLNKVHDYFIQAIAENRDMPVQEVTAVATGEFYLGVEAKQKGLIDQLGGKDELEDYIMKTYNLNTVDYVIYQKEVGLLDVLGGVVSDFFFKIGQGIASVFVQQQNILLM
jgi:protease IV